MSVKTKAAVSIAINCLMAIITAAIIISYYFADLNETSIIQSYHEVFYFFTTDSNILAALAGIVIVIFDIQILRGKRTALPKAAVLFKYAGTATVMMTLLVCLFYLAPRFGFAFIFGGTYFHVHLAAPLMAFISLCFFEKGERLGFAETQTAYIPFVIYGIVYTVMAMVIGKENGGWRDLYHFNDNGNWLISVILLVALYVAIVIALRFVYNIRIPKESKQTESNQK